MQGQYNMRSPAVKRLMKEAQELREPTELYHAQPLEDNLFEWHFTLRGPEDSEFDGGIYHGRIILPPEYPMKPPSIILLTPNGRFEIFKKICLSISGHHPESWQPSWSIRTALLAIIGFMPTHGGGAIGSLDYTPEERKVLAKKSQDWRCPDCGDVSNKVKPITKASEKATQEAKELASQINFQGEKAGATQASTTSQSETATSAAAASPNTTTTPTTTQPSGASTPTPTPTPTATMPPFPNPWAMPPGWGTPAQQNGTPTPPTFPRFPYPPPFMAPPPGMVPPPGGQGMPFFPPMPFLPPMYRGFPPPPPYPGLPGGRSEVRKSQSTSEQAETVSAASQPNQAASASAGNLPATATTTAATTSSAATSATPPPTPPSPPATPISSAETVGAASPTVLTSTTTTTTASFTVSSTTAAATTTTTASPSGTAATTTTPATELRQRTTASTPPQTQASQAVSTATTSPVGFQETYSFNTIVMIVVLSLAIGLLLGRRIINQYFFKDVLE